MKTTRRALAFRVAMRDPGDVSGLAALFDSGALRPEEVVAILGKTEGNGCVNDFTRSYATHMLAATLGARLGLRPESVAQRVALVMSGGTEGGLSPHFLVLGVREEAARAPAPSPSASASRRSCRRRRWGGWRRSAPRRRRCAWPWAMPGSPTRRRCTTCR